MMRLGDLVVPFLLGWVFPINSQALSAVKYVCSANACLELCLPKTKTTQTPVNNTRVGAVSTTNVLSETALEQGLVCWRLRYLIYAWDLVL